MPKAIVPVAIIGAGPYGLSVAAHIRQQGIPFRIFGRPMDSWLVHMPKGMMLKSDGFASDIYDPDKRLTLKQFCADQFIAYADTGVPVRLETFVAYGLAFQERMVPELEEKQVISIDRSSDGFRLRLGDGETFQARRVVLAVGITHFDHVPSELAHLPPDLVSHSSCHHDLEPLRGRRVVVIGGGSSALDLAGLLNQARIEVQLVTRRKELKFHSKPTGKPRSWWQQIRHPQSGLGPGMRSRFFANAPQLFYHLPERLCLHLVRTTLGPSGGWFAKDMVVGRVPTLLGHNIEQVEAKNGMVQLHLRGPDGNKREITADHVVAATGYKVQIERLKFLSESLRATIKSLQGTPVLASNFESSIPGLYFIGVAAANSFGPVMRFAFGARFAAERVTQALVRSGARSQSEISEPLVTERGVTSVH